MENLTSDPFFIKMPTTHTLRTKPCLNDREVKKEHLQGTKEYNVTAHWRMLLLSIFNLSIKIQATQKQSLKKNNIQDS